MTATIGYDIEIIRSRITAVFASGQKEGALLRAHTKNGMRVYLDVVDLPFALADLPQTGAYIRDHEKCTVYGLTQDQHSVMMGALDAKVQSSEPMSLTTAAAYTSGSGSQS